MGLAGNKNRTKLSHDPNNTAWAKDTSTFGHKILSKQGWKQGDFLGAENASHSAHYTAANASHIRVMLREDNLGLGAKIRRGSADTFGLSMFSGLLGRLNGMDDGTLKKQEDAMRDAELRLYQDRKFGFMNFVSGGLLVGDKMEPPKSTRIDDIKPQVVAVKVESEQKSKKRKASDDETEDAVKTKKKQKSEKAVAKKEKKSKSKSNITTAAEESSTSETPIRRADESSSSDSSGEEQAKSDKRKRKEQRKAEKVAKRLKSKTSDEEKTRSKEERRAHKEERRKRKEEKRRRRAEKEASSAKTSVSTSAINSEAERSGTSTPTFMGGRQALRQRYIMQKRMASSNAAALKEIFMLQPQAASS